MQTQNGKFALQFKRKQSKVLEQLVAKLTPQDLIVLKQKIAKVKQQNRRLKGKFHIQQKYNSRLSRTLSLIQRNGYKSNGPNNNFIERVISEKSAEVLCLKDDISSIQQERTVLRKQILKLKQRVSKAPKQLKVLKRAILNQQANLYVLINAQELNSMNLEELNQKESMLQQQLESLLQSNLQLKSQILDSKSLMKQIESENQKRRWKLNAKLKKLKTCQSKEVVKNGPNAEEMQQLEEEQHQDHQELLMHAQKAIEEAVLQKLEKKRQIISQLKEIETLRKEWLILMKEIQQSR